MQTLVVDANFLMSAYRFKVNAISELNELLPGGYRLVTGSPVIKELEGLKKSKSPSGRGASFALDVLGAEKAEVIQTSKNADDWIVDYCSSAGAIACTNDASLRRRLREKGVRSIVLLGRSRLAFA